MECRLCLRSNTDSFEFNSEEGIKQQALNLLRKHFPFCFTNNTNGGRVCRQCWNNVESFNTFYLQIQNLHVHIYSLKNEKIVQDVSVRRLDETKSFEGSDPVIVKVESLTATDEISVTNVLASVMHNTDLDVKWIPEMVGEPSVSYIENAFDTHLRDKTDSIQSERARRRISTASNGSQASNLQNNSDTDCKWKPGPLQPQRLSESDSDDEEPPNTKLKDETCPGGSRAAKGQEKNKLRVKTQCHECGDWFLTHAQLQLHIKKTHKVYPFKCDTKVCVESFETVAELDKHKLEKHANVPCPHCKKELRKVYLPTHIKTYHSRVNQVICDVCGFVSPDKAKHKMHYERNHMDARAQCDICGQWFKNKIRIRLHFRNFHINKPTPVKCTICGWISPHKKSAWDHKRTHNEGYSTKFKCLVCGKGFATRVKLKEHSNIHTGLQPYKCQHCEKTFRFGSSMSLHKKKCPPKNV